MSDLHSIANALRALDGPNRCDGCKNVVNLCSCHEPERSWLEATDEEFSGCDMCEALGEYCADCRLDLGLDDDGAGEPGWRRGE